MSHLGSLLTALADGQLPPAEADRVLAHAAGCEECGAALRAARAARRALASASDVAPGGALTDRLLALGSSPEGPARPAPGRARWHDGTGFADSVPLPGERRDALATSALRGDVPGRRKLLPLGAAAGCAALLVGALALLGDRPVVTPESQRGYALAVLSRALPGTAAVEQQGADVTSSPVSRSTADGRQPPSHPDGDTRTRVPTAAPTAPVDGPEAAGVPHLVDEVGVAEARAWLVEHGWVAPDRLPPGYTVAAVRTDVGTPGELEVDLDGPHGSVVVLQRVGRLDPVVADRFPQVDLEGRAVHLVCRVPWHVTWQAGDVVISVLAQGDPRPVVDLVTAFPAEDFDDGVTARIARGWSTVAGAWGP